MAVRDIEAFIRERARQFDPNMNTNPGGPFDVQVIQPLTRRLGVDPWTVDLSTFLGSRMQQAFPEISNQEEDAITDLLNKPATLLWDPIVREVARVRQNLSFSDPSQMTTDEADALGANFFTLRKRGGYSRGVGRIFFSQPQSSSVSPANFFTSKGGLHYFPIETQSITTEEMILNVTTDGLYYFDINVIAEEAGTQYNIEPNALISVANIPAATKVTNLRRFRSGELEENAQAYITRVQQELSERSLVTLRGVSAKLVNGFPEINRLNVVGFGDPEMQRDIIVGGGLGQILAGGNAGLVVSDGEGKALQRRFRSSEVDFIAVAGAAGAAAGLVITVFDAFGSASVVRDLKITRIVGPNEVDVEDQVLVLGTSNLRWTLRRNELTLSKIPGGILFPNTPNGTLTIPDDTVHVGGMYDTYIRGSGFDPASFSIENVTDDNPLLSGPRATVEDDGTQLVFQLNSLVLGTTFIDGDQTAQYLDDAVRFGYTLQVQDAPEQGNYRILAWSASPGSAVRVVVDPPPTAVTSIFMRWRLFDVINIDLLEPKETRISGTTMSTLQNSDVLSVTGSIDFLVLGVAQGDTVEIESGPAKGRYTVVVPPLSPTELRVDTVMSSTNSSLPFKVFRSNQGGGLQPPFIRITDVELLDSSNQPLGTKIPYALPVDVQSRAFQNPGRGVKHDLRDAVLGIVSRPVGAGFNVAATDLVVTLDGLDLRTINLPGAGIYSLPAMIAALNSLFYSQYGQPEVVVQVGEDRFGIRPIGGFVAIVDGGARTALFGDTQYRSTGDIRSLEIQGIGGWAGAQPPIDMATRLDVLQVLDGADVGFFSGPFTPNYTASGTATPAQALVIGALTPGVPGIPKKSFAPAIQRRVQVGARSIGSARVYFMDPTSFEVDEHTRFSLDLGVQGVVTFTPDPSLSYQQLPALPSNIPLQDGTVTALGDTLTSAQDFIEAGIQAGDRLEITNTPIEGSIVLTDPMVGLAGLTLTFSLDGSTDRVVIFLRDDNSLNPGEVSKSGVVSQINSVAGEQIVELTPDNRLRFNTAKDLVVRGVNTINNQSTAAPLILGDLWNASGESFSSADDVNNESPFSGSYDIVAVSQTELQVSPPFPQADPYLTPTLTEQTFYVYRVGVQRISSTQMAKNAGGSGLYYFDVELVSEGTGDLWNVNAGQQLVPSNFRSDGYYLTTDDSNLTFSEVERPRLVLSRTILESGVDDSPANATQLTGQNIQVSYDRSQLTADTQNFLSSETERVICANPLSRHLIPYFVRMDVNYTGGASEDDVLTNIETFINDLPPVDTLDASDVQKIVTDQGANYVQNPLDVVALVYRVDRTIWVERSNDRLAVNDRLSAFIPDQITLKRETG